MDGRKVKQSRSAQYGRLGRLVHADRVAEAAQGRANTITYRVDEGDTPDTSTST
ncbi:hypothetical protein LV779_08480 [Streptomyces thinghirensis]|nr:hypothetical protein [Streptomyces thinghirensis]